MAQNYQGSQSWFEVFLLNEAGKVKIENSRMNMSSALRYGGGGGGGGLLFQQQKVSNSFYFFSLRIEVFPEICFRIIGNYVIKIKPIRKKCSTKKKNII